MADLTYREAARRVKRSIRTIKRWRKSGMPMKLNADGMRVVEETVLLNWWRERLNAWPPHRYRMRKLLTTDSTNESNSPGVSMFD